jgi:Ca2+/H+ antiporter, TMEM165/GDT1 family
VDSALLAFVVVFVAELGDKTQLVAVSLATRHRVVLVLSGIAVAFAITQGFAALVGGVLGAALPERAIGVGAAGIFFGFAIWTWRDIDDDDDGEIVSRAGGGLRALGGVIVAMSVAELGDKTMLATTTLAADRDPLPHLDRAHARRHRGLRPWRGDRSPARHPPARAHHQAHRRRCSSPSSACCSSSTRSC